MQITTKFSIGDYVYPVRRKGIVHSKYYVKNSYKIHEIIIHSNREELSFSYHIGKRNVEYAEDVLFYSKQQALRYSEYRNIYLKRITILLKRYGEIRQNELQDIYDKYKDIIKQ